MAEDHDEPIIINEQLAEESTPLTYDELVNRALMANNAFDGQYGLKKENRLTTTGNGAEVLNINRTVIVPDKSPTPDRLYDPLSGNVRLLQVDSLNYSLTKHLLNLSPDEIRNRMESVKAALLKQNIPFEFEVVYSQDKSDLYTEDQLEVRMIITTSERNDRPAIQHLSKLPLDQKEGLYIEFKPLVRKVWNKLPRFPSGVRDGDALYYEYDNVLINVPYTPGLRPEELINSLNLAIKTLQTAGLLPESADSREKFSIEFAEKQKPMPAVELTISEKKYQEQIATIHADTLKHASHISDPYLKLYYTDLSNITPLPYAEAIQETKKLLNSDILKGELVAKMSLCCLRKKINSDDLVFVLPAADTDPFDPYMAGDYHNIATHERVVKTWNQSDRIDAVHGLANEDFVRGYLAQLTDGRQIFIPVNLEDIHDPKFKPQYEKFLNAWGISEYEGSNKMAEELTMRRMLNARLNLDAAILRRAGMLESDVLFYRHWYTRFNIEKSANLDAIYDKVSQRYEKILDILTKSRSSHRSSYLPDAD